MRWHARILCLFLALAGMGITSATTVAASTRTTGTTPAKPPGYAIVSASFPLPNGVQTSGSVTCPVKKGGQTVPFSGGALLETDSLDASINSSFPLSNGWSVDANNTSGAASRFTVFSVCAAKRKGYVQQRATTPVPAGTSGFACRKGDVLLGGGVRSGSS